MLTYTVAPCTTITGVAISPLTAETWSEFAARAPVTIVFEENLADRWARLIARRVKRVKELENDDRARPQGAALEIWLDDKSQPAARKPEASQAPYVKDATAETGKG